MPADLDRRCSKATTADQKTTGTKCETDHIPEGKAGTLKSSFPVARGTWGVW